MILSKLPSMLAQLDISPLPSSKTGDDATNAWQVGILLVAGIMAVVALMLIVINGMMYVNAAGDPQKVAQARMGILYAVVGLVIVLMSATIVSFAIRGIS